MCFETFFVFPNGRRPGCLCPIGPSALSPVDVPQGRNAFFFDFYNVFGSGLILDFRGTNYLKINVFCMFGALAN